MNENEQTTPLLAYVSASRIGHQAWEVIQHCSFANRAGRRLLIFLSSGNVNHAFHVFDSERIRFFQLESKAGQDLPLFFQEALTRIAFDEDDGGRLFRAITALNPALCSRPFSDYWVDYFDFRLPCDHFSPLAIQEKYHAQGECLLEKLGLSQGDWYVCLHLRASSFLGDTVREWQNQTITNYLPLIEHLTALGAYVIRMGDPSMPPLPQVDRVVDYAHSPHRSPFADIFLSSKAKFFIGSQSGLRVLPMMLGTPLLNLNYYPLSLDDIQPSNLTIFKRVFSEKKGDFLTLREIMADPMLCHRQTDEEYRNAGLSIRENTPEEVLAATCEYLDLLKFDAWTPEQRCFQEELRGSLRRSAHAKGYGNTAFNSEGFCRIAQSYLREHW